MASLFGIKIDNLRKRSRVLLACLEDNARVVREEVKKLGIKNPSTTRYLKKRQFIHGRNSDVWKLRNDSSGVGAALCPDYFRVSPKYESLSVPDMSSRGRLLLRTEKKLPKSSPPRRGIKECYCQNFLKPETRKISQRSARTRQRNDDTKFKDIEGTVSAPESGRVNFADSYETREDEEPVYSPPLSSATLIRAQKIDYTPRSKFLRKVQSKINTLRSSSPESPVGITPRSQSPSSLKLRDRNCENIRPVVNNTRDKNEGGLPRRHNCLCVDKEDVDTGNNIPKKTSPPKKTITSKKLGSDQHKLGKKNLESRTRGCRSAPRFSPPLGEDYETRAKIEDKNLINFGKTCPCSEYEPRRFRGDIFDDEPLDLEINNVRKFREKNYFDTHASNPSSLGSRSSRSLQQYRLNERLFPEPMGRIHREDLVVSIPPCATRQRRGIHYFPRTIVRQEKNTANINHAKKRRCPSCPLIGHTVDLGVLKVSHPTNSLALRYQKGIP